MYASANSIIHLAWIIKMINGFSWVEGEGFNLSKDDMGQCAGIFDLKLRVGVHRHESRQGINNKDSSRERTSGFMLRYLSL